MANRKEDVGAADTGALRQWLGHDLIDRDGDKVGTIVNLYLDEETGQPDWAVVRTGLLGSRLTLVPLDRATVSFAAAAVGGGRVTVPYDPATILDAPSVALGQELAELDTMALLRHYGVEVAEPTEAGDLGQTNTPGAEVVEAGGAGERPAQLTDRPTTISSSSEAPVEVIRSEEELRVGKRRRARRVRLKRYVVTDYVTKTIPVQREEVRLEEEPVEEPTAGEPTGPPEGGEAASAEGGAEVLLREEEVVIQKRVVPRERVRLTKEVVTEERPVSGEVRKEQVEVDDRDVGPSSG
jgi:stress response protein YsnF/sporulation protein YlmC with PRC-barrel domain